MKRFLITIRWALLIEVLNSLLGQLLRPHLGYVPFHAVTIAVLFWSGWLVTKKQRGSLAHAAWAGPVILVLGFMLVGVLYNLITGDFSEVGQGANVSWVKDSPRLAYLVAVLGSTILFLPLAALVSVLGGVIGRKVGKPASTNA